MIKKVAVVGVGAISCAGLGANRLIEALLDPPQITGQREVKDYVPAEHFDPKEIRRIDRFSQLALVACREAFSQASLGSKSTPLNADPYRIGVIMGTGIGGLNTLEDQVVVRYEKGEKRVSPFLVPMMMPNSASANISLKFGTKGPCETITTACAASNHAILHALNLLRLGKVDICITGGAESAMTITSLAAFRNMTALSSSGVSRPFDIGRDGFVMGEGAAILVLEELSHAQARQADILAIISGGASLSDSYHITAPEPDGLSAAKTMSMALDDAGIKPDEIAYINAHGTSTPLNDATEAKAIQQVFHSQNNLKVTSNKGLLGHSLGAAGALEAVASVLSFRENLIPPTANTQNLDDLGVTVVTNKPCAFEKNHILSNSFGFGGHNCSIVISRA